MNGFIIGVLIALVVIAFLIIMLFLTDIIIRLARIENDLNDIRRTNP